MIEATEHLARLDGYAAALFDVARAEGDVDAFVDEFYAAAKTISANSELRDVLSDSMIPIARRQGTVTELLPPATGGIPEIWMKLPGILRE